MMRNPARNPATEPFLGGQRPAALLSAAWWVEGEHGAFIGGPRPGEERPPRWSECRHGGGGLAR